MDIVLKKLKLKLTNREIFFKGFFRRVFLTQPLSQAPIYIAVTFGWNLSFKFSIEIYLVGWTICQKYSFGS